MSNDDRTMPTPNEQMDDEIDGTLAEVMDCVGDDGCFLNAKYAQKAHIAVRQLVVESKLELIAWAYKRSSLDIRNRWSELETELAALTAELGELGEKNNG